MLEQLTLRDVAADAKVRSDGGQDISKRDAVPLYCRAVVDASSLSDEERTVDVIASTEDIDAHGTIVRQNWQLERFRENPVILYSHDRWDLPIGTATKTTVENKQLRATIKFSTAELNPRAEQVWQNVKAKVLRGISVGFYPHSITFERQDDVELMVLDDNELWEISVCPVPSNPKSLTELRQRALSERAVTEPHQQTPPPEGSAETKPEPFEERDPAMAEKKEKETSPAPVVETTATPSIARALGLPAGSPESEILAAAARCRELEVQITTITDSRTSNEALGAVRELVKTAERVAGLEARLAKVEGERDEQDFETAIKQGLAERKLTPAEAAHERECFARDRAEGRGAARVEELRGRLRVASARIASTVREPNVSNGPGHIMEWNGLKYGEMSYAQRARLSKEDPELYRAMKSDHDERRKSA